MKYVTGVEKVQANLARSINRKIARIIEAVEMTAVDVRNHAAEGHQGDRAHMEGRYANRTTNLTNSLAVSPPQIDVSGVEVIVFAGMEYAPYVEHRYPFMFPALEANRGVFKERMKHAMRG